MGLKKQILENFIVGLEKITINIVCFLPSDLYTFTSRDYKKTEILVTYFLITLLVTIFLYN